MRKTPEEIAESRRQSGERSRQLKMMTPEEVAERRRQQQALRDEQSRRQRIEKQFEDCGHEREPWACGTPAEYESQMGASSAGAPTTDSWPSPTCSRAG